MSIEEEMENISYNHWQIVVDRSYAILGKSWTNWSSSSWVREGENGYNGMIKAALRKLCEVQDDTPD